jgi:hypothetical protein
MSHTLAKKYGCSDQTSTCVNPPAVTIRKPQTTEGPGKRVGAAAVAVGNSVLLMGGANKKGVYQETMWELSAAQYPPTWVERSDVRGGPDGRKNAAVASLLTRVVVHGGIGDDFVRGDLYILETVPAYRWRDQTAFAIGTKPTARSRHTMAGFGSSTAVVFGGLTLMGAYSDELFKIDLSLDPPKWYDMTSIVTGDGPSPRAGHAMSSIGRYAYIYGGEDATGRYLADLWVLRANSDFTFASWEDLSALQGAPLTGRAGHALVQVAGSLLLMGGTLATRKTDSQVKSIPVRSILSFLWSIGAQGSKHIRRTRLHA